MAATAGAKEGKVPNGCDVMVAVLLGCGVDMPNPKPPVDVPPCKLNGLLVVVVGANNPPLLVPNCKDGVVVVVPNPVEVAI
jgi:hypothetical protein